MDESDNFAAEAAEIKTIDPSTDLDNPENLNFEEPGEEDDQVNQDDPEPEGTEPETAEAAETDQEAGEQSEEADAEPIITLKGGEQVPLSELKSGYMRDADYRQKTQAVANDRKTLEQSAGNVTRAAEALADFLAGQLPPEPTYDMAIQNPAEYARQKAIYDASLGNINKILAMAQEPKGVSEKLSAEDTAKKVAESRSELEKAFPQIKTEKGNTEFFQRAFETGRNLGFSEQEMQDFTDHRYLKVIHYAHLGLQAEKAKEKALAKVANAPQAVPAPRQRQNLDSQKNKEAMRNLQRSGSIQDAMQIDFE